MAKRKYSGMEIAQMEVELNGPLLTGSVTSKKIDVNTVEVEPFVQGFGGTGDPDFKDISFD